VKGDHTNLCFLPWKTSIRMDESAPRDFPLHLVRCGFNASSAPSSAPLPSSSETSTCHPLTLCTHRYPCYSHTRPLCADEPPFAKQQGDVCAKRACCNYMFQVFQVFSDVCCKCFVLMLQK
jgi:hypothetical protein